MKIERLAALQDNAVLVGGFLLDHFAREHLAGTRGIQNIDANKAWDHVYQMVEEGVTWICRDSIGTIVGSISVIVDQHWWTKDSHMRDGWFYVTPAARGTRAAVNLLMHAERHAREHRMDLYVNVMNSADPDRTRRFMVKLGYIDLGPTLIKEFN